MDILSQTFCVSCGAAASAGANFCSKCGNPLGKKPLNTSLLMQATIYLVSLFLPPFGFWYAWKYLRESDGKAKKIGAAAAILTIFSLIITIWALNAFINSVQQSLNLLNGLEF